MSRAELESIWPTLKGDAAERAALRIARIADHTGDASAARAWIARAGAQPGAADLEKSLAAADAVRVARVAVLLPESGVHAGLGREIKAAIEIAGAGARDVELRFYDTRGEEAAAESAVARAAADGAVAIVGPVGQAESRAAAASAAERGVPIALLAPSADGASPAAGIFRLWPSPEWEAAEAARWAIELGHDRLAVLAPRDEQGAAQTEAFRRAAVAGGVQVVATGTFDPTGSDLEPDVKAFLGLDPARNERLRRHLRTHGRKDGWKSFSPDVPFDLLYVPDEHGRAALIASYLPYFNIEVRNSDVMDTLSLRKKHGGRLPSVVQLLGSSAWFHAGLIPRGKDAVDGAVIVVACPVGAAGDGLGLDVGDAAAAFGERFEARTGRAPGPVAAQAHDAALIVLAARAEAAASGRRGAALRGAMRDALSRARLRDGACGAAQVEADGQLSRRAGLMRVDGDEIVPHEQ